MIVKKQLYFFRFLILAFITISIALFLERQGSIPRNELPDTEHFKSVLFEKEKQIDTLIKTCANQIEALPDSARKNLFETFANFDFKSVKEQGFIVLAYVNDSLQFWSDNSIKVPDLYSNSKLNNIVLQMNNAWFYVRFFHKRNIDLVGLIKLKDDFAYENEYLENRFHPDFNLPYSVKISPVKISYSFEDICNTENTYLFSLVPINTISKREGLDYIELLYFLAIAFIFIFINKWLKTIAIQQKGAETKIIFIFLFLLFIRYLMTEFKYPLQLYSSPFFTPENFADLKFYPSLGDFFINSLIILVFTRSIFYLFRPGRLVRYLKKQTKIVKYIFSFALTTIVILYFNYIIYLLESLVTNSDIPFAANKIMSLNLNSLLAYNVIGLLLTAVIFSIDYNIFILKHLLKTKLLLIVISITLLIYSIIVLALNISLSSSSLIYLISSIVLIMYVYIKRKKYHYSLHIILIIIGSIYITMLINNTMQKKDNDMANKMINQIISERDRVAEHFLVSVEDEIKSDILLREKIVQNDSVLLDGINKILKTKYFKDYFDKYKLDLILCNEKERNCANYYNNIIETLGKQLGKSNFYYINDNDNTISYNGFVHFINEQQQRYTLYIILESISQDIDYPDILIEGKANRQNTLKDYSYAKYTDGRLVLHSGVYPYDLNDKMFRNSSNNNFTLTTDDFKHYIKENENNILVLTQARAKTFDLIIAFSYIFLFFNLFLLLTISITNFKSFWSQIQLNFENKLLLSMFIVMILSFAMVTTGTVYYNASQFKQKHNINISDKLESVLKNLEMKDDSIFTNAECSAKNRLKIQGLLKTLSKIYYTDINLYNNKGRLITSSRNQIFDKGLIGGLMNPEAYKQITINEKQRFIHNEKIGKLEYASAYELMKNSNMETAIYINFPYFTKPAELRNELTNLIVAIVNLYVVLFIIVAFIAFFMANKITQPLRMIQNKFKGLELGKKSEQIFYDKNDEVGALVDEYNKMVIKLDDNVKLLAKTERESAWREMAKQIAHEIKNPLTPMKLSVQFLLRAWQNKDDNFDKKLEKSSKTLIDQITTLSNIATEFSNFAKMPKPKKELVDIVVRVEHTVELFVNTENLTIETNVEEFKTIPIIADHEHISRVLTNLVKNGIQAVPVNQEALIKILLETDGKTVLIKIIDNGSGIAEEQKDKLFTPNFTTKSSGMGMGLPIVKDIVESANGKIWFETKINVGTTFFVEFPLAKN